jgi:lambda family phage minor tail protein L
MAIALVELFQIDLAPYLPEVRYYHNYGGNNIVFNNNTYLTLPFAASGFEDTSNGFPSPQLQIGNADGAVSKLIDLYDGLRGCLVTRIITTKGLLNAPSHPNNTIGKAVYRIDRPSSENALSVTFDLKANLDIAKVTFPREIITRDKFPLAGRIRA